MMRARSNTVASPLRRTVRGLQREGALISGPVFTQHGVVVVASWPSTTLYLATCNGMQWSRASSHRERPSINGIVRTATRFARQMASTESKRRPLAKSRRRR